jgi:hypothetical protein
MLLACTWKNIVEDLPSHDINGELQRALAGQWRIAKTWLTALDELAH